MFGIITLLCAGKAWLELQRTHLRPHLLSQAGTDTSSFTLLNRVKFSVGAEKLLSLRIRLHLPSTERFRPRLAKS